MQGARQETPVTAGCRPDTPVPLVQGNILVLGQSFLIITSHLLPKKTPTPPKETKTTTKKPPQTHHSCYFMEDLQHISGCIFHYLHLTVLSTANQAVVSHFRISNCNMLTIYAVLQFLSTWKRQPFYHLGRIKYQCFNKVLSRGSGREVEITHISATKTQSR